MHLLIQIVMQFLVSDIIYRIILPTLEHVSIKYVFRLYHGQKYQLHIMSRFFWHVWLLITINVHVVVFFLENSPYDLIQISFKCIEILLIQRVLAVIDEVFICMFNYFHIVCIR